MLGVVDFELDLFWTYLEVQDIPALFKKYPGRFKLCHVKDLKGDVSKWKNNLDFDSIKAAVMVNVGEGEIPFADYFALNDVSGLEHFILEHDSPPVMSPESCKFLTDINICVRAGRGVPPMTRKPRSNSAVS